MNNYKISGLDHKTPKPRREKLQSSLKAVAGVESVKVIPEQSQISISWRAQQEVKPELIKTAVSSAGFSLVEKR